MQRSRLAVACGFLGALGVFDAVLGPVLIHLGVLKPIGGFLFFGSGLLFGLLAVVLSPFALRATRPSAGRAGRALAWLGLACGVVLLSVAFTARRGASSLPPINDITTDVADPPAFVSDPSGAGRDMAYPPAFAPQVKAAYGDLAPIRVSSEPARALALAEETARELGWEVVGVDPAAGTLIARQTTRVFRFVDDVVVRVRPGEGGGSIVDVRSKSRDGRGDLGTNAARIRAFAAALPR